MSIKEIIEKCKSPKVFISIIIVLTAFASFGLGRLSILLHHKVPINVVK
ncbi:MAG: hypothetical protein NUV47_00115 [Patescibacteria group bacterium]|nr:hypothetical protein [Patescibacteria group bacterium]